MLSRRLFVPTLLRSLPLLLLAFMGLGVCFAVGCGFTDQEDEEVGFGEEGVHGRRYGYGYGYGYGRGPRGYGYGYGRYGYGYGYGYGR